MISVIVQRTLLGTPPTTDAMIVHLGVISAIEQTSVILANRLTCMIRVKVLVIVTRLLWIIKAWAASNCMIARTASTILVIRLVCRVIQVVPNATWSMEDATRVKMTFILWLATVTSGEDWLKKMSLVFVGLVAAIVTDTSAWNVNREWCCLKLIHECASLNVNVTIRSVQSNHRIMCVWMNHSMKIV